MTSKKTEINVLITPAHTLLGDEIIHPKTINIVLENGHSYSIEQALVLLEKLDKKHKPRKPYFQRTKRVITAIKTALKEPPRE